MKSMHLLDGVQFSDRDAHAEPLYVDRHGRVIRFSLKPGQSIKEHSAPDSPFYAVVLKGRGWFAGGDGKEAPFGPNALLIFEPRENHMIRALDEELVFVGFLHGASNNISEKKGGTLGRKRR